MAGLHCVACGKRILREAVVYADPQPGYPGAHVHRKCHENITRLVAEEDRVPYRPPLLVLRKP